MHAINSSSSLKGWFERLKAAAECFEGQSTRCGFCSNQCGEPSRESRIPSAEKKKPDFDRVGCWYQ
ncbi:hypothetical protein BDZ91DRAFT_716767 [Kalaharituber pfeilii]|nr:hypothetical protein BDZ91DRAFT_716767 [Kalaharituber pfeilii]